MAQTSTERLGLGELSTRQIPVKPAVHAEKVGIAGHEDENGRPKFRCGKQDTFSKVCVCVP